MLRYRRVPCSRADRSMKPGCFLSLALLSGLTALYHQWFQRTVDPPAVWIVSFIAAVVCWLCIGSLQHAWLMRKFIAAVKRHREGFAPMDGQLEAASGTIELHGEPILSPLTATECAFYEYEIYRMVQNTKSKESNDSAQKVVDFAGIGVAPSVIRTADGEVGLFGFADLADFPDERVNAPETSGRARKLVRETAWEDCTGLKVLSGFGMMLRALGSSDDSQRHDWRMVSADKCRWLPRDKSVRDENEVYDGDDTYYPMLSEKRVTPGTQIVAVGPYVGSAEGLVTQGANDNARIRIYRGTSDEVLQRVAASRRKHVGWALFMLVLMHLIAFGMLRIYRGSTDTQKKWRKEFEAALKTEDLSKVEQLVEKGLNVKQAMDHHGKTALMLATSPEIAQFLLKNGADVNATDEDGMTPLMEAARHKRTEVARVLIAAGADLNIRSKIYGTPAIVLATDHDDEATAELLRSAGAVDDVVRRATGQEIAADHPAVEVAREYILAIHARDPRKLRELSASTRPAKFDDVDWELWHNTRPVDPQLVAAFVREPDATVTLTGATGRGNVSTWTLQMKNENGVWKVTRERWLTAGYQE